MSYGYEQCLPKEDDAYLQTGRSKEDEAEYAEFKRWREGKNWIAAIDEPCGIVNDGPKQTVFIQSSLVRHKIDTGSPVNVIDQTTYEQLKTRPRLQQSHRKFYAFKSDEPLPILGMFRTTVSFRDVRVEAGYIVAEGTAPCLLSYGTAKALGIAHVVCEAEAIASINSGLSFDASKTHRQTDHEAVTDTHPVQLAQRPVPSHLRDAVEKELETSAPTPWVSNWIVAPKGNSRRNAKSTASRPHNPEQRHTLKECVAQVKGAVCLTKIDTIKAFFLLLYHSFFLFYCLFWLMLLPEKEGGSFLKSS